MEVTTVLSNKPTKTATRSTLRMVNLPLKSCLTSFYNSRLMSYKILIINNGISIVYEVQPEELSLLREEGPEVVCTLHRVLVAERDQGLGVGLFEKQIAG